MERKFRASYSVLSKWAVGTPEAQEEAIKMFFKLPSDTESYMKEGQRLHKEWELEAQQTKCAPAVFGGRPLNQPHWLENKIEVQINEWLEVVGVIDRLEFMPELGGFEVTDYKSGDGGKGDNYKVMRADGNANATDVPVPHQTSTGHLSKPQLGLYVLLAERFLRDNGHEGSVKRVSIQHLNQSTGLVDNAYKWVDQAMRQHAVDWLVTWASDMHNFLLSRNVYADPWAYMGIKEG